MNQATEKSTMESNEMTSEVQKAGAEIDDVETFKTVDVQQKIIEAPKPIRRWQIREDVKAVPKPVPVPVKVQVPAPVQEEPIQDLVESNEEEEGVEVLDNDDDKGKGSPDPMENSSIEDPEVNDIETVQSSSHAEKLVSEPIPEKEEIEAEPTNSSIENDVLENDEKLLENRARNHRHRFLFSADA
jgi:hypothetical protein